MDSQTFPGGIRRNDVSADEGPFENNMFKSPSMEEIPDDRSSEQGFNQR
jgi:hypothetical protein